MDHTLIRRVLLGAITLAVGCVAATPAWAAGEFEPNDSITQTAGPLSGGVNYTATFDTANDQDWYRFYIRQQTQLRVTVTAFPESGDSYAYCDFELLDRTGAYLNDTEAAANQFSYIDHTLYDPGIYYLVMTDCSDVRESYRFNLSPPGSIVANDTCGGALTERGPAAAAVDSASRKVAKLKERVRKARNRGAKQRLKASLRAKKGLLAGAQAALAEIDGRIAANC